MYWKGWAIVVLFLVACSGGKGGSPVPDDGGTGPIDLPGEAEGLPPDDGLDAFDAMAETLPGDPGSGDTAEATGPRVPALLAGYDHYTFDARHAPAAIADLVQSYRDGGMDAVRKYAALHAIPVHGDAVELMIGNGRTGADGQVDAEDLETVGGKEIGSHGAVAWYLVPVEGLSSLFDRPGIVSMNGLWIPELLTWSSKVPDFSARSSPISVSNFCNTFQALQAVVP